jgi:hypothetical protein
MIRLFKHYVPYAVLFLALVDLCLLLVAAETAWVIRANQIGMHVDYIGNRYFCRRRATRRNGGGRL